MENWDRRYIIAGLIFLLVAVFAIGVKYADFKNQQETKVVINEENKKAEISSEKDQAKNEAIIQVYVCGAVTRPGVYRLPEGARLYEAIDMAEAKADAEVKYLEMARQLVDGESILVPAVGENIENGSPGQNNSSKIPSNPQNSAAGATAQGKLNINRASVQELDEGLPGIGPSLAQRIVDYRSSNGDFKQIEDIKNVSGIGDKKFAAFKEMICVR